MPSTFHLAPHVAACRIDEQVILLDLRRNRYVGIGGKSAARLTGVVEGWPADPPVEPVNPRRDTPEALDKLLSDGLVRPGVGAPAASPALPGAARSLAIDAVTADVRLMRAIWPDALVCVVRAWSWLRLCSFASIALLLATRRAATASTVPTPTLDPLPALLAAYETLRPLLLTRRDRCLHDALALTLFLAARGIASRWVIGVRVRPFVAHAWVQAGDLVIGDEHFRVGQFRPILVA